MLTVGIKGEQSQLVTNENTAKTMGKIGRASCRERV